MEQENLIQLFKEFWEMDTTHQEYKDNNIQYVVDSQKDNDTLTIKVQLKENEDKKNFEEWLSEIDDDLFSEVLEELTSEKELIDLNTKYNSEDFQEVIDKVKSKTKEVALRKIKKLQKLI